MLNSCPRCGGLLYDNYDGLDDYKTCLACGREFDLNMTSRAMDFRTFYKRYGIVAPKSKARLKYG